ncbi:MAG: hypothetical protein Q9161_008090 [Pseudevernia consocians]
MLTNYFADDFSTENSDNPDSAAPVPTAAIEPIKNATAASNGTVKASSLSSAAAVATTPSSPLNSTNDPNMCHKTSTTDSEGVTYIANPFCEPVDGQEVYPDIQYQGRSQLEHAVESSYSYLAVTWDTSLFEDGANNTVQVYNVDATDLNSPGTADILASLNATNFEGSVFLNMSSAWLSSQPTANLTIALIVDQEGRDPEIFAGPVFTLLSTSSSDSTHSEPSSAPSSGKKLGEKVGLPIGLVFLIVAAIAVAFFVCFRKRRGKGYGTGKSLRQRVSGGAGRGHRRDPSFHDEPTTGVELKDRNKGLTGESPEDNWEWGSPVSSPTTAGGAGNAFRDEIQRQRSRR